MREEFLNEIKNEEKNINEQIFKEYFGYESPSFLVKDVYEGNQNKNDMIVKYLNESLIDLRNNINIKKLPENENPKKVANIVEKIIDFNKQQKAKEMKILTPIQIPQRLPIALSQVKARNTSEIRNQIRQIIYSLNREIKVTKKVYNNIRNSIMDNTFMNSENSKTTDPHRLSLNLTYKINLKKSDKYVALPCRKRSNME